jgi:signal transduction histidine kinase
VSCEAEATGDLSPAAALCIYRVTQEALQNVAKHALAKEAEVRLECSNELVCLTVSDSGVGCSLDRARASGGLGLVSMHERVRLVNGTFEFKSEPSGGTTVKVGIPVKSAREQSL